MIWEVAETTEEKIGDVPVVTKKLVGHVDNSSCPANHRRHPTDPDDPGRRQGPVPVMMEFGFGFGGPRPGGPAGKGARFGGRRAELAAAGARQGLGLRHHRPQQHPGRQRRGPDPGDHRSLQQGPAAQGRRLGVPPRLGLGRQPGARLLRDRPGRRRQAGRHRGPLALRQGGAGGDGLRPAVRDRLHRLVRRGGRQAAPPQLRRAGREPHRVGRIPLDGREFPEVRRPAHARTTFPSTPTS